MNELYVLVRFKLLGNRKVRIGVAHISKCSVPGVLAAQGDPFPAHNYVVLRVYFSRGLGLRCEWVDVFGRATVSRELQLE